MTTAAEIQHLQQHGLFAIIFDMSPIISLRSMDFLK